MVQQHGIDVYVAPFGKIDERYKEYPIPAASLKATNNKTEAYIEARDGERFVVVVDLKEDFDKKGKERLKIVIGVDKTDDCAAVRSTRSYTRLLKTKPEPSELKGRFVMSTKDRKVDEIWTLCGFMFSPLKIGTIPDYGAYPMLKR